MIREISKDEMLQILQGGADLVDVRETDEIEEGKITESKNWPLSSFGLRQQDISRTRPTIFYCRSGMRSMKAAEIASFWTSQEVFSLRGGFLEFTGTLSEKQKCEKV